MLVEAMLVHRQEYMQILSGGFKVGRQSTVARNRPTILFYMVEQSVIEVGGCV